MLKREYTKEELKEIIVSFKEIINNIDTSLYKHTQHYYICVDLEKRNLIALNYFKNNKPSKIKHTQFYSFKYFNSTSLVWWNVNKTIDVVNVIIGNNLKYKCNKERIRFLKYLIKNIKLELKTRKNDKN